LSVASNWESLREILSCEEIRYYSYQLFLALDYCHSGRIIHRDINPTNLHIDRTRKLLKVMSWHFAVEHKFINRYEEFYNGRDYRSPELLVKHKRYGYGIDMWAAGCVIGATIFPEKFISNAAFDDEQLFKLASILGWRSLQDFLLKFRSPLARLIGKKLNEMETDTCLEDLVTEKNRRKATDDVIDLLKKLLVYQPKDRLHTRSALNHPYFFGAGKEQCLHYNKTERVDLRKILANGIYKEGLETCKFYQVMDKTSGKEYVAKVIDAEDKDAIVREYSIAKKLIGWPHINHISGIISSKIGNIYLHVYEYVEAAPWDLLYNSLSIEDIRLYIYQLLMAVEVCQMNNIIHRNIKPSNILIDCARKQAYLADFSQATFYSDKKPLRTDVGTIPYCAPEILLKQTVWS
uniref:non-specific serine/threonine protein kinase n=1 Tax=Rodentolepis nana TaxID=102285 RepID=A0A0R3T8C4_RODNA